MFTTTIIDVAIGLILTYLVLSLVCVSITEAIGSVLRLRARVLFSEVNRLLADTDLQETFWDTPIVRSVSRAGRWRDGKVGAGKAPSYLHSRTFVAGLFAAADLAEKNKDLPDPQPVSTFADLAKAAGADTIFGGVLTQVVDSADVKADAVRDYVEDWFDTTMERAAGVFKRWMQLASFVIALGIAVVLNADTIRIASALWSDEVLRSQLVEVAKDVVKEQMEAGEPATEVPAGDGQDTGDGTDLSSMEIAELIEIVRPLPLGWSAEPVFIIEKLAQRGVCKAEYDATRKAVEEAKAAGVTAAVEKTSVLNACISQARAMAWIYKVIGLVITAFALSLGAPFWFDLLSRFVSIRGAGPGRKEDGKKA